MPAARATVERCRVTDLAVGDRLVMVMPRISERRVGGALLERMVFRVMTIAERRDRSRSRTHYALDLQHVEDPERTFTTTLGEDGIVERLRSAA